MEKNKLNFMEYICTSFDKYKYILLVCLAGIVLTMLPTKNAKPEKTEAVPRGQDYSAEAYAMESNLQELLQNIEGVGRTQIMLTAKRSQEPKYIYNQTKSGQQAQTEKSELVILRGSKGEEPVIASIGAPEYMGAVILCDGASSAKVQLEITQAVSSLTGITSDNIKISQLKK